MKDKELKEILIRYQTKTKTPKGLSDRIFNKLQDTPKSSQQSYRFMRLFGVGLMLILFSFVWLGVYLINWDALGRGVSKDWISPSSSGMLFGSLLALLFLSVLLPFLEYRNLYKSN
ncbi:MAG: hypothetical protein VW080_00245 [Flavobacteriaceae bacterium]